jgi:predicted lipid-binding transport protein (Tim44 family)
VIQRRPTLRLGVGALGFGAAVDAFARAGRGEHGGSHSSGGSSGGSSHGSGFHSSVGPTYSYSTHDGNDGFSPGVVIMLLILFVVIWIVLKRIRRGLDDPIKQRPVSAPAFIPTRSQPNRPRLPAAIEMIRAQDPGFEIETFLQRAEMSYFLVTRGIQRNEPAAVRPYLNDPLFAEVSRRISQTKAAHRHMLLESLNVRAIHLDDATCNDQGQSLQVHFDLVYRAKSLDDSNRVIADEGDERRRGERWTFVRSANARTPSTGDVTASHCPACGVELQLNLDGTCLHCKASATNGSVDWVVADIQPAPFVGFDSDSQMAAIAPSLEEGIECLRVSDAAFSIDAFTARVRTAFTTLQDAWCKQNIDSGRAFLSPGAYFAWRAQLETMALEGRRNIMEYLQVRSIQPARVVHGRVFDDLTVRITAASADYEVDNEGRIVFGDRTVRPFTEEWTFQRSVGVATSNKPGTLENMCPNCGAPVSLTQIGECRYCKATVTSGKFDWVVSRIEQEDNARSSDYNSHARTVAA